MLTLLDISMMCPMIQRLNSYNLLTEKVAEKVPWTISRSDKQKTKKVSENWKWTFHKGQCKSLRKKSCLSFCVCQKKIVKFTYSTHTIYRPTNVAKKAANY